MPILPRYIHDFSLDSPVEVSVDDKGSRATLEATAIDGKAAVLTMPVALLRKLREDIDEALRAAQRDPSTASD